MTRLKPILWPCVCLSGCFWTIHNNSARNNEHFKQTKAFMRCVNVNIDIKASGQCSCMIKKRVECGLTNGLVFSLSPVICEGFRGAGELLFIHLWICGFSSQINSDKLLEGEIQNSSPWRWENIDPVYKFLIPYPHIQANAKCSNENSSCHELLSPSPAFCKSLCALTRCQPRLSAVSALSQQQSHRHESHLGCDTQQWLPMWSTGIWKFAHFCCSGSVLQHTGFDMKLWLWG